MIPMHLIDLFVLGNVNATEILIHNGADINAQTSSGHTPLHYAAQEGIYICIK